jgi:hypothetical protein
VAPKVLLVLTLCAAVASTASVPACAAGPPLPVSIVPNTAQERLQAQLMIQQAQAQAQLVAARQRLEIAGALGDLSPSIAGPMREPFGGPAGTMELTALTPQLGRYFGTDHGVLVLRQHHRIDITATLPAEP